MQAMYIAERNYDLTEGRGPMVVIGYFFNREDAVRAVKGWGVMGVGDGEVRGANVHESFASWEKDQKQQLILNAMSKLTSEERRALGLEK